MRTTTTAVRLCFTARGLKLTCEVDFLISEGVLVPAAALVRGELDLFRVQLCRHRHYQASLVRYLVMVRPVQGLQCRDKRSSLCIHTLAQMRTLRDKAAVTATLAGTGGTGREAGEAGEAGGLRSLCFQPPHGQSWICAVFSQLFEFRYKIAC